MMKYLLILFAAFSALHAVDEEIARPVDLPSVMDFNSALQESYRAQDWWAVVDYADSIGYYFPDTPFGQEAPYHCADAYLKMGQFELANSCLSNYLNQPSPKKFEEAIEQKFAIAELYRNGTKLPLFDSHKMPRWAPSEEAAVALYDEVITIMPHQEIAAKALMGKAKVQAVLEDFKESVETFQLLIRRFPKEELAAEAFLEINRNYLKQSQVEHLDLDLLDLAELNLRKFHQAFPREERLQEAEAAMAEMRELYASNLLSTGRYYEKIKKIPASVIYYTKVIAKYPTTEAAQHARQKLEKFQADGKI